MCNACFNLISLRCEQQKQEKVLLKKERGMSSFNKTVDLASSSSCSSESEQCPYNEPIPPSSEDLPNKKRSKC